LSSPLIWVLTGSKTGDNAQVLRAASAMALPFVKKRLAVKPEFETAKPRVSSSLDIFDLSASDPLAPPWPDLIVTIGRRLSLAALWIKRQSGGKTKIALLNAPKGMAGDFDLIVAPAYYRLSTSSSVFRIGLPLIAADPQRVDEARIAFGPVFEAMPRPLHVLLIGGDTGREQLSASFISDVLARMQSGHAQAGSIFVSTSRRTSTAAADAAEQGLRPQDRIYRWSPGKIDNPYFGLLAYGDSFTVTSDSLSMLTEIARLGRPLFIAEPKAKRGLSRFSRLLGFAGVRDIGEAAHYLIRHGYAARLGERPAAANQLPPDDTAMVATRLRQLVLSKS
jgi:uncharacterized protein